MDTDLFETTLNHHKQVRSELGKIRRILESRTDEDATRLIGVCDRQEVFMDKYKKEGIDSVMGFLNRIT